VELRIVSKSEMLLIHCFNFFITKTFIMEHLPPVQNNVVIIGKAKSVGAAFFLAFLFGPLGLLYASVTAGIIMLLVALIMLVVLPVIGVVLVWFLCIIWAVSAANDANDKLRQQGLYIRR
jgi:hypothetical protein